MKKFRWLITFLILIIGILQLHLWFGDGGLLEYRAVTKRVNTLAQNNNQLQERNEQLAAEVKDLKSGLTAIEEHARNDLGMIRQNEKFIWVPQLKH